MGIEESRNGRRKGGSDVSTKRFRLAERRQKQIYGKCDSCMHQVRYLLDLSTVNSRTIVMFVIRTNTAMCIYTPDRCQCDTY